MYKIVNGLTPDYLSRLIINDVQHYNLRSVSNNTECVAMVKSVYSFVQLRVNSGGLQSNSFENLLLCETRRTLSPPLFLLFKNDIVNDLSILIQLMMS